VRALLYQKYARNWDIKQRWLSKACGPSRRRMLGQWRSAAWRCRAKWRFYRREAVGKRL